MSIRKKILILMIVLAVVCSAALGSLFVFSVISFVGNFNDQQLLESQTIATSLLEEYHDNAMRSSALVAQQESIIDGIIACRNGSGRQELTEAAAALMNTTNVDILTITDVDGNVLARAHDSEAFGDNIAYLASVQSALTGNPYTTVEKGTDVTLSVCSGSPVYDGEHNLIGTVSLGFRLDRDGFVDYVKRVSGNEATVFLDDTRISTTVLNETGERAVGTKASEKVSGIVLSGNDYIGRANVLGENLYTHYSPITDAGGEILGMLFVGINTAETDNHMIRNICILIVDVILLLSFATVLAIVISGKISRPTQEIAGAASRLAIGDLDVNITVPDDLETNDEIVLMGQAFLEMIKTNKERGEIIRLMAEGDLTGSIEPKSESDVVGNALKELLRMNNVSFEGMTAVAAQLDAASSQVADGAQNLADGATEQAATIEKLHETLKLLSEKTVEKSEYAREAAMLSRDVRSFAEKGNRQMEQMMDAMSQINKASESIEKVIKVIDDIAFQTNILALNASVEAARAGAHGKGFAVVAEEVRNLASKSAEAAKDTGSLIANSIEKANVGSRISADTAASFADIVAGVNKSSAIVDEIAVFMKTQNAEIESIAHGVNEIHSVVHSVSATAEESAASSDEVSTQAAAMSSMLAQYKLRGTK